MVRMEIIIILRAELMKNLPPLSAGICHILIQQLVVGFDIALSVVSFVFLGAESKAKSESFLMQHFF